MSEEQTATCPFAVQRVSLNRAETTDFLSFFKQVFDEDPGDYNTQRQPNAGRPKRDVEYILGHPI